MDRTIRIETNSPTVIEHARRALGANGDAPSGEAQCLWRVVTEATAGSQSTWPEMTAFSDQDLAFVNMAERGFLAADLSAREAVAFVAEEWANDELGFRRPFLAMLFSITAPCLQLLPVSAACVAFGQRGLLVFGPPRSGKTTSAYLAVQMGLEFHADQVVFLDVEGAHLRAWGEFWPAVFHAGASFLPPDVVATAQPFRYGLESCLYTEKPARPVGSPRAVVPASCIFLEAQDSRPLRLLPLGGAELAARLKPYCLFGCPAGSDDSLVTIWNRLRALPASRLAYDGDCEAAAIFLRSLLTGQELLEGIS
jgi:hypothetical protein